MDIKNIDQNIERILMRLKELQHSDGSWSDNNFINALVAHSLSSMKENALALEMAEKTATYILSQKSISWSWNYYPKPAPKIYPDDLDDTFCSLIALHKINPNLISEQALMHVAQSLFTTQVDDGGPYKTWIIDPALQSRADAKKWKDIDPAVNANIAYFLLLKGIELPNITQYIDGIIRSKNYSSLYYHNPLFVTYFIARGYQGIERSRLIKHIFEYLRHPQHSIHWMLGVCALQYLGIPSGQLTRFASQKESQPALSVLPLYVERISKGKISYATSTALGLAIEGKMYSLHKESIKRQTEKEELFMLKRIERAALKRTVDLPPGAGGRAQEMIRQTLASKSGKMFTLLPFHIFKNTKRTQSIQSCCLISLYGWMAYTIYDDIIDGDQKKPMHFLPLANIFLREMTHLVHAAATQAPQSQDITATFSEYMNRFDAAMLQEKPKVALTQEDAVSLPSIDATIDASLGFMIPSLVTFRLLADAAGSHHFINFFRQLIFLRQMSDNMLDWRQDIKEGIINRVTGRILIEIKKRSGDSTEQVFSRYVDPRVRKEMLDSLNTAQHEITLIKSFLNTDFMQEMLTPYVKALVPP